MEFRDLFERETLSRARAALGYSVRAVNPRALDDACAAYEAAGGKPPVRVGIKDTAQIPAEVVGVLRSEAGFAWVTVDRRAPCGRAVDPFLVNPLTGRPMTGSTSGGPVNIIRGIIDAAIGTDGGGSVLGPAVATGLYGMIGSGLGLQCPGERRSSDGYVFRPSLGVIAGDLHTVVRLMSALAAGLGCAEAAPDRRAALGGGAGAARAAVGRPVRRRRVAVPARGSVRLPDGWDMAEAMAPYVELMAKRGWEVVSMDFAGIERRGRGLEAIRRALDEADVVVTLEGPVDVFGLGDSVIGSLGPPGAGIQAAGGKYLLRAANMAGTTAVAVPVPGLASGLVIQGRAGPEGAGEALDLAEVFAEAAMIPEALRIAREGTDDDPGFDAGRGDWCGDRYVRCAAPRADGAGTHPPRAAGVHPRARAHRHRPLFAEG